MTGQIERVQALLKERFGKDTLIALATVEGDMPSVRTVNGYYEDGAFYVITDGRSGKMRHIAVNRNVAIAGEWFSARGRAINLGFVGAKENFVMMQKLKGVFAAWLGNGHTDLTDKNTCLVMIRLTEGVLFSHGTRYNIDFISGVCR